MHHLCVVAVHVDHPSADPRGASRVIRHQGDSSVGHHGPQPHPVPPPGDGDGFPLGVLRTHLLDFDVHLTKVLIGNRKGGGRTPLAIK